MENISMHSFGRCAEIFMMDHKTTNQKPFNQVIFNILIISNDVFGFIGFNFCIEKIGQMIRAK